MKTACINVRLDEESLGQVRRYKINISEVVRVALHSEVEKARRRRMKKNMAIASAALKKISMAQVVKDIREMRKSR